jgi:uncharacterized protein YjbJ (UPF0337 family)
MKKPMTLASAAFGLALLSAGAQAQGTMDKVEGTAKEIQGAAKETLGKVTGDTKLEWSGKADKVEGAAQNAVGNVKNTAGGITEKLASLFTWLGNFVARAF